MELLMGEMKDIKKRQREYIQEIMELKEENLQIEKKINILNNKMEMLEKEKRKNNLIISGLTIQSHDKEEIENT
ncbi:hypothetical protein ILUMI_20031, partial [Ignelater luminosus]